MKHCGLTKIICVAAFSAFLLGSLSAYASPRYGLTFNAGYTDFEPDSGFEAAKSDTDNDIGYRIGVFFDLDEHADRGFEFDVSWVDYGKSEYCLKNPSQEQLTQVESQGAVATSRAGRVCSNFDTNGIEIGATYVIPLSRLSSKKTVLDNFSGFIGGGYFDLDFNPDTTAARSNSNDDGFYWEAGFLWTAGFGGKANALGVKASYRGHDNTGIEYWSVGLVWDL